MTKVLTPVVSVTPVTIEVAPGYGSLWTLRKCVSIRALLGSRGEILRLRMKAGSENLGLISSPARR